MNIEPAGLLDLLSSSLSQKLPGHSAFLERAGYDRSRIDKAHERDQAPRLSAVLIAIYPVNEVWTTVLMKRPTYEGVHSGQIAFPGGRKEDVDTSLEETALREFEEETGAKSRQFEIIAPMSQLYIPPSRSLVTPFIAYSSSEPAFDPDEKEVEKLITVPFSELLAPRILKTTKQRIWAIGKELPVPYFDIRNEIVWGATAMMLAELREICGVGLD